MFDLFRSLAGKVLAGDDLREFLAEVDAHQAADVGEADTPEPLDVPYNTAEGRAAVRDAANVTPSAPPAGMTPQEFADFQEWQAQGKTAQRQNATPPAAPAPATRETVPADAGDGSTGQPGDAASGY